MFYSLEEAAEKLSKSKDEVKKLVKDGQLREFRDGPNILFKAEEVEALIPEIDISGPSEIEEPVNSKDETEILELAPEESEAIDEIDIPEFTLEEPETEAVEEEMEIPELTPEETTEEVVDEEPLMLEPEPEKKSEEQDDFIDFNDDTAISEIPEEPAESKVELTDDSFADFSLNSETGAPADNNDLNDLTDGDTDLVGQGTSILGLTDNKEYDLTDDTMA
ncbi:MAG: excisionase family DNA-binding protein, partial [Sedimentisphaerales bacterium]|nr:excisionase family DNA-binding protein [Sedimentisphaerales bacterium]